MGKATLVEADRRSGRIFIDALRDGGVPVWAGMWLRFEDGEYKLYIASPLVEREGPLKVYAKVSEVLDGLNGQISLSFDDVVVANTTNHFANTLATLFEVRGGGLELRDVTLNDITVRHAYIYHVGRGAEYRAGSLNRKQRRTIAKKKRTKQWA